MNLRSVIIFLLLLLGLGFAGASIYQAAWQGAMEKMGLVDSDFTGAVQSESLQGKYQEVTGELRCSLFGRVQNGLQRLVSSDTEKASGDLRLGEDRIACGAGFFAKSEVERGTYEVVKGLGYLKLGYDLVYEQASINYRLCQMLPDTQVFETMNELLRLSTGKVHELMQQSYLEVLETKEKVEPVCLKMRGEMR